MIYLTWSTNAAWEGAALDQPTDAPLSFLDVLDTIERAGQADRVNLGEILDSFGNRAFGPFMLVPALVAVLPVVGALPGVSLVMAGVELVVALQFVLGERRLHLPKRVRQLAIPRRALSFSLRMVRPVAKWAGKVVKPRLRLLTDGGRLATGALAVLLALLMFVGALVPGGIVPPALGMIVLGLGLTSQDGVLIVGSLTFAVASIALGLWWLL
jgi:hypothetical protein